MARTLNARSPKVRNGDTCRHCNRKFREGEAVVSHNFGRSAPYDLREFAVHADCVLEVISRILDSESDAAKRARHARAFRETVTRIKTTGKVFA
jgi:hypothetical protein